MRTRRAALPSIFLPALLCAGWCSTVDGQEGATTPHWIWHPSEEPGNRPPETRYFRSPVFHVKEPNSRLAIDATADNAFVLYLDGKEIARGENWQSPQTVSVRLDSGFHVLAAEARNTEQSPAAFLVRGGVLPLGQGLAIHTRASWRSAERVAPGDDWKLPGFDDTAWRRAQDLGPLGSGPWQGVVFTSGDLAARFKVPSGFEIKMAAPPALTGSAVAMTFDAQGRPVVSIERGPIVRLIDENGDGTFDRRVTIGPRMTNCQGLYFDVIDSERVDLWAVGDGPEGTGIYRWADQDKDPEGVYEAIVHHIPTDGMGEHGPHAITRGPDGRLYFNAGNHAHIKRPIDPESPCGPSFLHEGELLPHYNDARGHAEGVLMPCGEIYRSDDDGKTWSRIVCGFRNEYDFAFNRDGEIFSFDSDMEWDIGAPWYREVRVTHSPPGSEHGSRNGSGAMPAYFFDTTPPLLDVGRGSPTGVTFYQGDQFPQEYDDAFLACDWSQGRILAVKSQRSGGTYRATASDLVTGQPLNCTDIEVGPDGAVYFTTGGRGTLGGLFRVTFGAPAEAPTHSDAVTAAVLAPSPLSSFTRKAVMDAKARAGADWTTKLIHEHALNPQKPASMRVRALDLLNETGDATQAQALSQVCLAAAKDADPQVRAKAVQILGQVRDEQARAAVRAALEDTDAFVVRRAAESLVRQAGEIPVEALLPVLAHPDRFVRYAARVGLEHADLSKHQSAILRLENPRAALEGLLALARATKLDTGAQGSLFRRQLELLQASLPPAEQLDLLRLIGVTYLRGPEGNKSALDLVSPALRSQLLPRLAPIGPNEALSPDLQRETARLLAFLDEPQAVPKILTAQAAAVAADDRATALFYAYCLRAMKNGWTPESKQRFWRFLDTASQWEGGFSYLGYLDFMTQDLLPHFSSEERATLLETAATSPFPARLLVRGLEVDSDPALVATLAGVVTRLDPAKNPNAVMELKNLVVEKLGQSKARIDSAHEVLRTIAKSDPGRRDLVARALAASPQEADLPVLVAALESRDENTINTVLEALAKIDKAPAGPEGLRNLIRLARRRTGKIADRFPALALKWKPANLTRPVPTFEGVDPAIAFWSEVYRSAYNDTPALEDASVRAAYTLAGLTKDVVENGRFRDGSAERGKQAITKGRCLECHKFGNEGQGLGPDLTTVSSRFQPAEILESMIVPSKVISDQYKSTQVALSDGKILIGMPAGGDDKTLVLLLSDSTKVTIQKEQIEEQGESKISVMPDGLLDLLTVEEIADMLKLFDVQPRVEVKPGG